MYNFSTHSREQKTITIYGANVIIFEGILALYDKRIRDLMDVRVSGFCMNSMRVLLKEMVLYKQKNLDFRGYRFRYSISQKM